MTDVSLPRNKVKIVLTENVSPRTTARFEAAGYTNVTHLKHAPEPEELTKLLNEAHIIGIRSRTELTAAHIEQAPKLFAVGCFCIGTNQVASEAAALRGIPVFNAPFSNTRSVAELTISSIIALMRRLPENNAATHRGEWLKSAIGAHEVRGKTLGIVGYGNIGVQLSVLAGALGMRVIYYDPKSKLSHGTAEPVDSLTDLYKQSDIISYHVPELPETKGMVNKKSLTQMKPGVHLINYARGSIFDVDALCESLRSGHVAGAAIDVFPEEPASKEAPFISPLRDFDNVILTPHIGGSTEEAQENIGLEVAEKLITYSENGSTLHAVNFPEVSLPRQAGAHRITNVHRNVPGMLGLINTEFSKRGVNITGQYLQTNGEIGYVVIDIEPTFNPNECKAIINSIEGSVRTRVIKDTNS